MLKLCLYMICYIGTLCVLVWYMHTLVEARGWLSITLLSFFLFFGRVPMNWELVHWLVSPWYHLYFPVQDLQACTACPWLFRHWDPNSGPHVCAANTLPTEPFPQSHVGILIKHFISCTCTCLSKYVLISFWNYQLDISQSRITWGVSQLRGFPDQTGFGHVCGRLSWEVHHSLGRLVMFYGKKAS